MLVLIKLFLAHIIGDFLLQPGSWVAEKEQFKARSPKLYLHFALHGVLMFILLWGFEQTFLVLAITLSHGIIDTLKLYAQNHTNKPKWFLIDQFLHVISLVGFWIYFTTPAFPFTNWLQDPVLLMYCVCILAVTIASSVAIQEVMANWSTALNDHSDASLISAGKYIGMMERLFVFTFVVMGRWEGIGFLMAAKSIFRFGDLKEAKDRKLTEYILIGTLLSFGIAMALGVAVVYFHTSRSN